jgi:hypothetical protein
MADPWSDLDARFERALTNESPDFGNEILAGIQENWHRADKAFRGRMLALLLVALGTYLVSSPTASGDLKITIAGIELAHPGLLLTLAPVLGAYFVFSACESLSNIVWLSMAHDRLFYRLHKDAYDQDIEQCFWPGDSPATGAFGLQYFGPERVRGLTGKVVFLRVLALPTTPALLEATIIWRTLAYAFGPLQVVLSGIAAILSVYAVVTAAIAVWGA